MKFYRDKSESDLCWNKILDDKLTCILLDSYEVITFYKSGELNNTKNASYNNNSGHKVFYLNDEYYGDLNDFTKKSWRRFVKLQAFL